MYSSRAAYSQLQQPPEHVPYQLDVEYRGLFFPMVPTIHGVTRPRYAMHDSWAHVFVFGEQQARNIVLVDTIWKRIKAPGYVLIA